MTTNLAAIVVWNFVSSVIHFSCAFSEIYLFFLNDFNLKSY